MADVVADRLVVQLEYTVHLDSGDLVDSSGEGGPMEYIHGVGDIFPGMERALKGAKVGDRKNFVVPFAEAYGPHRGEWVVDLERKKFAAETKIQTGAVCVVETPQLGRLMLSIQRIAGEHVTCDFNHPLAGENLHFNVKVVGVRAPAPNELEQGFPDSLAPAPSAPNA